MIETILKTAGTALMTSGLLMIYFYGISPRFKKGPGTALHSSDFLKKERDRLIEQEIHYKKRADIGLVLSLLAILTQFIGIFI